MSQYLIAHDLGTSGNKATLFTTDGQLVKSVLHTYPTHFFNGNWAEQNPEDWWEAVCHTNGQLLEGIDKKSVAGVAFSGQMMACVLVDKNGAPLRDAIIWADSRSIRQENQLREKIDEQEFYRITGHKISASYGIEKLMWIRDNQPERFQKAHKMLNPKDYMVYRLTGVFATDYSDASSTNCFDLEHLEWSERILRLAGISPDLMPDAHPSTFVAGEVSGKIAEECGLAAGTPIVLGGGDGVCASVGAGSVSSGAAYNYLGSSSWISLCSEQPIFDDRMRTFNWAHMIPGMYVPTGTMQAAGNSYHFMRNTVCDGLDAQAKEEGVSVYQLMDRLMAQSETGANGLLYLPYLLGERSPRWNPNARGAFIGLKMEHTKGDLLRATVEGILMNLSIVLEVFRTHTEIREMNIIGGLAKGAPVRQILADVYGVRAAKLCHLDEATSMGAAVAAGVGTGVLPGFEAIDRFIQVDEVTEWQPRVHEQYEPIKKLFDQSYYALMETYEGLSLLG